MTAISRTAPGWRTAAAVAVTGLVLAGCGAASSGSRGSAGAAAAGSAAPGAAAGSGQVLPVAKNPITNTATARTLKIDAVMVENNVDPTTKKTTNDHLEIALSNSGSAPLSGVEVFYTFTDRKTKVSESYYSKLPDTFSIPAGATRTAHFDASGKPDHFPVNKFSLYYQSKNPLDVSVTVSATGAAVQTTTVKKDAGGPESAD